MVIPLKNPLEGRPTVLRVLRSMNIDVTQYDYEQISFLIFQKFDGIPEKVRQRKTPKSAGVMKVCCFPASFIPTMVEIIEEYYKPKPEPKKKRPRINKIDSQ